MTYGFRPQNWPAFQAELARREIPVADIEKIEMRPDGPRTVAGDAGEVTVTVTLRSGRVESWRWRETPA
jgi:hypothetical protein